MVVSAYNNLNFLDNFSIAAVVQKLETVYVLYTVRPCVISH
ncbi:8262_t:CDS:2 [Dentiscutata erythropus]|uniref:8262_t:CDS:1 n=1 Tax=Dentiscutata erythropus TaxID=1348616 RepID=A0A9N9G336_9GLOM|nr:8262_t:CDS:2 [Dentiscutata erythropus]